MVIIDSYVEKRILTMFKKIVLPALCIITPTSLFAAQAQPVPQDLPAASSSISAQALPYAGLDVYGGLSLSGQMSNWQTDLASEFEKDNRGLLNGRYGVLFGVDKTFQNWLNLGLQASFSTPFNSGLGYEKRANLPGSRDQYYETAHYALAFLPGLKLQHALLFASLSQDWQRFKMDHKSSTDAGDFSGTEHGRGFGFGMESEITKHVGIRLSHDIVVYDQMNSTEGGISNAATYSATNDISSLNLTYHLQDMSEQGLRQPKLADGLYTGLMVGRDNLYIYEHEYTSESYNKQTHIANGSLAGVKLGYTQTFWQRFNLGAEASYDASNPHYIFTNTNNTNRSYQIDKTQDYKFSIAPGYLLQDSNLVFARLGVAYSEFTHTNSGANNNGNPYSNKTRNGPLFGLGYKTALTEHINVGLEDNYILYSQDIKSRSLTLSNWNRKFRTNQFIASLNYVF
jgi:hypothetical protein